MSHPGWVDDTGYKHLEMLSVIWDGRSPVLSSKGLGVLIFQQHVSETFTVVIFI